MKSISLKKQANMKTLRQLIQSVPQEKVFRYIWQKDQKWIAKCDRPTIDQITNSYSPVWDELLKKEGTIPYKYPLAVKISKDPLDKTEFVDVHLINPRYVKPLKGLKPWGGSRVPKGHYNVNAARHNKSFAFGYTSWSEIIDTPVYLIGKARELSDEAVLGEILWEMTFNGWTEKDNKKFKDMLNRRLKEVKQEIKEGKGIVIPPKKKGERKIAIPDSVLKEMTEKKVI